jgi:hypothetical protein
LLTFVRVPGCCNILRVGATLREHVVFSSSVYCSFLKPELGLILLSWVEVVFFLQIEMVELPLASLLT